MNLAPYKKMYSYSDSPREQTYHARRRPDPFEFDPFKVQSYNFRYAERPTGIPVRSVPMRNYRHTEKNFETYYYNHSFIPRNQRCEKENFGGNRFHEGRRRKFLHENCNSNAIGTKRFGPNGTRLCSNNSNTNDNFNKYHQHHYNSTNNNNNNNNNNNRNNRNPSLNSMHYGIKICDRYSKPEHNTYTRPTSTPPLLSRSYNVRNLQSNNSLASLGLSIVSSTNSLVCNPGSRMNTNVNRRPSSISSIPQKLSNQSINILHKRDNSNVRCSNSRNSINSYRLQPKSSKGSFCKINININGLDDQQSGDGNVSIEIETDINPTQITRNIANTAARSAQSSQKLTENNSRRNLNLKNSKTFVIDKRLSKFAIKENLKKQNSCVQNLVGREERSRETPVRPQHPSKERLPGLVAWHSNDLHECFRNESNDNIPNTSHMRRMGEKFNNNYSDLRRSQHKLLNTPSDDKLSTLFKVSNKNNNDCEKMKMDKKPSESNVLRATKGFKYFHPSRDSSPLSSRVNFGSDKRKLPRV